MDELRLLGATLAKPGPSADTIARRRHQLQNAMRAPSRNDRRPGRLMIAIGVTAATGAMALTAIVTDTTPPTPTHQAPTTAVQMSGRQILLAAATTAEAKPATTGTYWYVKSTSPGGGNVKTFESWTKADGQMWTRSDGGAVTKLPKRFPITVRGTDLGLAEIKKLPTSPAALKAKLLSSMTVHPEVKDETRALVLLGELLSRDPAPPKVRAAAFRALATLPDIKDLGQVPGGRALRFSGDGGGTDLVVNTRTADAIFEGFSDVGGSREGVSKIGFTARWTDDLPG